jgi:serine/threonine protein kinase
MADRPDDGPRGTLRYGEQTGTPARPDPERASGEPVRDTLRQPELPVSRAPQGAPRPRELGTADTMFSDIGTAATHAGRDLGTAATHAGRDFGVGETHTDRDFGAGETHSAGDYGGATSGPAARAALTATSARAYADGVVTTVSRQSLARDSAEASRAFALPYKSSEVIGRLGSYDLLVELGRGAMGIVYKAFSLQLCRPCALKVMIPSDRMSAVEIQRFQNEAMLAARLQNPHIVSVFDAGEDQGWYYIVMELIDGKPLTRLIDDGSEDAMMRGIRAIAATARALHYAHGKGIVHRDIKPDNILIDGDGNPHVTDFGIAKNVEADARMTMKGMLVGTPIYMSPEQANGEVAAIGPRSDIYSLGVTLYEMCTGEAPFESDNVYDIIARILSDEPPKPRDVARRKRNRDLPLDLETICLKAIEKDAARRYQTGQALAEDIEAYLEDRPISARPIGTTERLQKLIRRNRGMFVIAAVVFATLLVVGGAFAGVMIATIQQTSASLRVQDEQAALGQANVLERSIRANMLQGRADVVRELVEALRKDPSIAQLDVVRTDRSLAYTDLSTKNQVERRLQQASEVWKRMKTEEPELAEKFPQLDSGLTEVREVAFANIMRRKQDTRFFDYDRAGWNDIVENVRTVVRSDRDADGPMLTVLKPIENSRQCQVCHGEEGDAGYGPNKVRAVLVVKRSQKEVERRIEENKRITMMVGGGTASVILLLVWVFARIFGVRLRRRRFAA